VDFLVPKASFAQGLLPGLQQLFLQCKATEPADGRSPLDTLLVDGFDPEQVWEQIQLLNESATGLKVETSEMLEYAGGAALFESGADVEDGEEYGEEDDEEEAEDGEEDADEDDADEDESEEEDSEGGYSEGELPDEEDDPEADGSDDSDAEGRWSKSKKKTAKKPKGDGVGDGKAANGIDNQFFKMADMNAWLDQEDQRASLAARRERTGAGDPDNEDEFDDEDDLDDALNRKDGGGNRNGIDMFAELESDDSEEDEVHFNDFFDPVDGEAAPDDGRKPSKRRKVDANAGSDDGEGDEDEEGDDVDFEDDEGGRGADAGSAYIGEMDDDDDPFGTKEEKEPEDETKLSKYQKQQKRLREQIDVLEEFNANEKPWQLKGEVQGGARPMDSLLGEDLDFEVMTRPAPEITEETTHTIEDIIKQRIKDAAFDDVERKEDPKNLAAYRPKDRIEMDGDKSTTGLGDLYEQDFERKASGATATAAEEKMEKQHAEINELLATLTTQLNALTNFHFTPGSVHSEITVQTSAPAISLEEATPAAGSAASLLAPEEVYGKKAKGDIKADSEKTSTDKKRERRSKKKLKHDERLAREAKQKEKGIAGTVTKQGALAKLSKQSNVTIIEGKQSSGGTSSAKFFKELSGINEGDAYKKKKKESGSTTGSKLRL
jgi:U3 small nucleolar RNA-associated protein MPP10